MITFEECQYYSFIGQFYLGLGEIVELGPWLGRSTFYLLERLKQNPQFFGKQLHLFDDFVWRSSWRNDKVAVQERLENHRDFRFLFDMYTGSFKNQLRVTKSQIAPYDSNEHVEPLEWDRRSIELLFVDCGRTFEVNQAWYELFSPSFIRDRTLIVMQDWRLHFEIPIKWHNQTKQFTDAKGRELQLIHELEQGGIAAFLYRGQ